MGIGKERNDRRRELRTFVLIEPKMEGGKEKVV